MKQIAQKALVGTMVIMGYSTGNYGGGFVDSPSGLPSYFSSVTPANYGGGFIPSPPLNSGSVYVPYPNRSPYHYGGGFVQSPPVWNSYQSYQPMPYYAPQYSPYPYLYLTFY